MKKEYFVTPTNDLSEYRYTRSWDQGLTEEIYGYTVNIPDMPPKEEIINFGRPISEQLFRRTLIPKDLYYWEDDDKDAFVEQEYHRRTHGLWFYIKGKPTYIPGLFYYYLNYWPIETGKDPDYRRGDWRFFMIWMHVVLTDTIYGLIVYKCRRIGDTEKALCMLYEYASRVKNTINYMADCRTETDIKETFARFKISHRRLKSKFNFMSPIVKDDDPAKKFDFSIIDKKSDEDKNFFDDQGNKSNGRYEYPEISSSVSYITNESQPDGKRVGRLYVDEFGKMNQINPSKLWKVSKKALHDTKEGIIGKSLMTSTIEDLDGGKAYAEAKKQWEHADPEQLNQRGETTSGLIRIVRGMLDNWKTDKWGEVDEEAVRKEIKDQIEYLKVNKEWDLLTSYRRQHCIDIQDVFFNVYEGSNFNIENIQNRLFELEFDLHFGTFVRGDLEWADGLAPKLGNPNRINKKCRVVWVPRENGRFYISQHPEDFGLKSNRMMRDAVLPRPYNDDKFACGIDPTAQKDVLASDDEKSKTGLAIKRILDMTVDSYSSFDDRGNPLDGGRNLKTNRYCCAYLYRHQDPADNYDDWLKALVYYGTDFLIEKQHASAFEQYLDARGFGQYYMENNNINKNYRGQTESYGITANEKSINLYFSLINTFTNKYCNTVDIPIILQQWGSMVYGNQGKHDLGVATGFCEVAAEAKGIDTTNKETLEETAAHDDFIEEHVY